MRLTLLIVFYFSGNLVLWQFLCIVYILKDTHIALNYYFSEMK